MHRVDIIKYGRESLKGILSDSFLKEHFGDNIERYVEYLELMVDPRCLQKSFNRVYYEMVIHSDDWQDGDEEHRIPCTMIFHEGVTDEQIKSDLKDKAECFLSFMGSNYKVWIKIKKIEKTQELPSKVHIQMKKGEFGWDSYPKETYYATKN